MTRTYIVYPAIMAIAISGFAGTAHGQPNDAPAAIAAKAEIEIANVLVTPRFESQVPAEATGRVREVLVGPGDRVMAGQTLARIDSRETRLVIETLKAELARLSRAAADDSQIRLANNALSVALKDLDRAQAAAKRVPKSVSQAELDRLQLSVEQLEIEVERAHREIELEKLALGEKELALQAAQFRLDNHVVTAARPGVIAEQAIELGEWVTPGEPIFRIVTLSHVRVEGLLPGGIGPNRFIDAEAVVRIQGQSEPFLGTVQFVAPEQNHLKGETLFWVLLDNEKGLLRPGDHGSLRLSVTK
jgi:multidrug efflux pump subunit AcrA (membrane-fusion protein)